MLAQKTRQKVAIRLDKVGHFTHTFESLSPEIYTGMRIANADNMICYLHSRSAYRCRFQHTYIVCVLYSTLLLRTILHQVAREPDCRGAVKRGLTVCAELRYAVQNLGPFGSVLSRQLLFCGMTMVITTMKLFDNNS